MMVHSLRGIFALCIILAQAIFAAASPLVVGGGDTIALARRGGNCAGRCCMPFCNPFANVPVSYSEITFRTPDSTESRGTYHDSADGRVTVLARTLSDGSVVVTAAVGRHYTLPASTDIHVHLMIRERRIDFRHPVLMFGGESTTLVISAEDAAGYRTGERNHDGKFEIKLLYRFEQDLK
ncbi:hypothetical protein F66182_549 [Fusarium sp. NRRL 66182]|nr:hypothetical protein F66182_549 [Fusarium sp. NRRL 66182]